MIVRKWLIYKMPPLCAVVFLAASGCFAQNSAVMISVDAHANRHKINPNIYGTCAYPYDNVTTTASLKDLHSPVVREGGNSASVYNWKLNADNRGADWYFTSFGDENVPGGRIDKLVASDNAGGAATMVTIPMVGYVANLTPDRKPLWSYSIKKYGPQTKHSPENPAEFDAGNGISAADGHQNITGNDPLDAFVKSSPEFQKGWIKHLVGKWGKAAKGGVKYYIMDNEIMIWQGTHRDIHPTGPTMDEIYNDIVDYASMIKSVDPTAKVAGPEEWGWTAYFWSGYDQQHFKEKPDRAKHNDMDYVAWLLQQLHAYDKAHGKRLLDVFTLHGYPYGGASFGGGDDPKMQLYRNRGTRSYWDPNYKDPSWVNDTIRLIPRMHDWVNTYYPGTQIGITEYNWGDDEKMNGATCQADILGIFGREGLDLATRWTTPGVATPTFKAMKMYRNYDDHNSGFGDTSVSDTVPNADEVSSFAAQRTSDGALTVMVINKVTAANPIALNLANFKPGGAVQRWRLASNAITRLSDVTLMGDNSIADTLEPQSITLYVIPKKGGVPAY